VTVAAGSVLVVGEALVDIVRTPDGRVSEHPGGSPANVALTLARLGRTTTLLTRLGQDARGRTVADHLSASGVVLEPASFVAGPTSTAAAQLDAAGGATYEFDLVWDLPRSDGGPDGQPAPGDGPPLCLHTGSIAAVLEPGAARVRQLVEAARPTSTISYDPNLRPALMGAAEDVRPVVESLVGLADVVKLSDEDARWLVPGESLDDLAERWLSLGPAVVVVTRGGSGARAWTAAGAADVAGRAVTVADTVGAGDSFSGGLVDALWSADLLGADRRRALAGIDEATLARVVTRAIEVSAVTVSRPGADPPTVAELGAMTGAGSRPGD
jgi:fructokinase